MFAPFFKQCLDAALLFSLRVDVGVRSEPANDRAGGVPLRDRMREMVLVLAIVELEPEFDCVGLSRPARPMSPKI